jgi:hypothetical protein
MKISTVKTERRLQHRMQAVLPVRVRGVDASGSSFEELAHTLDLGPTGARLGSIRRSLKALDTLLVFYRQRRMEFKVIWTKRIEGRTEYHVGLETLAQAKEGWGMNLFNTTPAPAKLQATSGAA